MTEAFNFNRIARNTDGSGQKNKDIQKLFKADNNQEIESQLVRSKSLDNLLAIYFDIRSYNRNIFNAPSRDFFYNYVYDYGLTKSVIWTDPEGKEEIVDGINFLNRPALMYTIVERFLDLNIETGSYEYNNNPFTILFFDGKNIGSTNILDTKNNTLGGDLVLNKMARAINTSIQRFGENFKRHLNNISITPARYGGDEFFILIDGEIDQVLLALLQRYIKEDIQKVEVFYKSPKKGIFKDVLKLKNDQILQIKTPKTEFEKEIFFKYVLKHSLLNEYELRKIVDDINTKSDLDIDKIQASAYYPKSVTSIEDKLAYIAVNKPNLSEFVTRAIFSDRGDSNYTFSKKILAFYETIIHNPAYGHEIEHYDSFVRELIEKKNSKVIIVNQKFLKEVNHHFSIARGDELLKSGFWFLKKSVQSTMVDMSGYPLTIIDNSVYGSKGGEKMVFGDYVDENIYDIIQNLLSNLEIGGVVFDTYNTLVDGIIELRLPYGYAFVDVGDLWEADFDHLDEVEKISMVKQKIEKAVNLSEDSFYLDLVRKLDRDEIDFDMLQNSFEKKLRRDNYRIDLASINTKKYDILTGFYDTYLTGPVDFSVYRGDDFGIPLRYFSRMEKLLEMAKLYQNAIGCGLIDNTNEDIEFSEEVFMYQGMVLDNENDHLSALVQTIDICDRENTKIYKIVDFITGALAKMKEV
jgi:GGDEF domain-containing protein